MSENLLTLNEIDGVVHAHRVSVRAGCLLLLRHNGDNNFIFFFSLSDNKKKIQFSTTVKYKPMMLFNSNFIRSGGGQKVSRFNMGQLEPAMYICRTPEP